MSNHCKYNKTVTCSEAALNHLEDIECTNPQEKTTDKPYDLVERVDDVAHWWSAMVSMSHITSISLKMLIFSYDIFSLCVFQI